MAASHLYADPLPDESFIWQEFKQSNLQAFTWLYEAYFPTLHRYGQRLGADRMVIQDAIHDLYLDLWRMRKNLADNVSVRYYLCRSLRRRIHLLSKNSTYGLDETHESQAWTECCESHWIREESSDHSGRWLSESLGTLSKREHEVVMLRYYRNNSVREVATQLAIKEQTVRNLIQRALGKLRKNVPESMVDL
ncbi:RNA polymerase sigma factor [Salmonirosea aquatica]|uniref:RNA polymerase sigma factor n=1 Tax=Salmonirosea aquatica TaxID=2654236 RepID=UPI00128B1F41